MHEMKHLHYSSTMVQDARAAPSFSRIPLFLLLVKRLKRATRSNRTLKMPRDVHLSPFGGPGTWEETLP